MREADFRGVQCLAPETVQRRCELGRRPARNHEAAPVDRIADQRVTGVRQVQPDLVRAPGLERHAHPGMASVALDHAVMRHGLAPARAHGHAQAIHRVPIDRRVHLAACRHHADADRLVLAVNAASRKRLPERHARGFVARDDQQPRGVLVEAVHDAGARQLRELRVVRQQRVLQGAGRVAGAGMHDQARGLLHDQHVAVLPGDGQRDVLRRRRHRVVVRRVEHDAFATGDDVARPRDAAIDQQHPVVDPALQARAREFRQGVGERLIEAPAN